MFQVNVNVMSSPASGVTTLASTNSTPNENTSNFVSQASAPQKCCPHLSGFHWIPMDVIWVFIQLNAQLLDSIPIWCCCATLNLQRAQTPKNSSQPSDIDTCTEVRYRVPSNITPSSLQRSTTMISWKKWAINMMAISGYRGCFLVSTPPWPTPPISLVIWLVFLSSISVIDHWHLYVREHPSASARPKDTDNNRKIKASQSFKTHSLLLVLFKWIYLKNVVERKLVLVLEVHIFLTKAWSCWRKRVQQNSQSPKQPDNYLWQTPAGELSFQLSNL